MSDDAVDDRDIRLGSLALKGKLVTPEQLRRALSIQAEEALAGRSMPIGSIMVRKGILTLEQLQSLLSLQKALRREAEPRG